MADLLGAGLAWLEGQRERFLTRAVIYRRLSPAGGVSIDLAVPATVGRTVFRLEMGPGAIERIEARDYLIAAVHLAVLGVPQRGDQVIEDIDGRRHTHEVMAPGREPHWRWSDANRRCLRIHTKHLTTEAL